MIPTPLRFALHLQGDRLIAAITQRGRLEIFIVEAEQPAAALRAELDARRVRPRTVAIGLPRAAVTVKPIELPAIGDLGEMVRFELERHVPFPADDAPFDFTMLPAEPGAPPAAEGGRRVLLAAADRRVVDTALRIAQEAGLRPTSVTVASHDLVDLVRAPRGRRIAWAHRIGADVELLLLVGDSLALSRVVASADDATLAAEIRRSLSVVRWHAVDEVWISGDGNAPDGPSTDALTTLGAPVTAPPYTAHAAELLAGADGEHRGLRQLAAAVAAGRRVRSLDLIPAALRPRRLTRPQIITAGVAAATLLMVLGALLVPGYRDRSRLEALNADINRLAPEVRAIGRLQQELDRKKVLLATVESIEANAIRPLPVLRELTELLPADAWLTLLSLDTKGAELTGQAAAASTLIPLLENSPRFERVEFASPVTRGRDKEQFRIVARWEGGTPRAITAAAPVPMAPRPPAPPAGATVGPAPAPPMPAMPPTPSMPPTAPRAAAPPARPAVPPTLTDPDAPASTDPTVQPRRQLAPIPPPGDLRR